jgi:putative ABC transport system substrate-binding protein
MGGKMMRRNLAISIFSLLTFLLLTVVGAQEPKKPYRLGYLSAFDAATESSRAEGVRLALLRLGYIEGQNITTVHLYADRKRERYPELAAELVRRKVDVIVLAGGLIPIQVAKNATKTIPLTTEICSQVRRCILSHLRERAGALMVHPIFVAALEQGKRIAELATKNRLPTISDGFRFAEAGGLITTDRIISRWPDARLPTWTRS